jgi:beta-galactosidase/beta-glucuronidase
LEQALAPPRVLGTSGRPIPIEYPTNFETFYATDYHEDASWHNLAVPGNWEMAGFSPATYNQPDNASGFYRLQFEVPKRWKGRQVKIHFDGVQNGCEVWCNGLPVAVEEASWGRTNYHESGWTAWQADITPIVQFGRSNLLALRVTKNAKGVDCDTGDYFLLGGVYRPVTLFSVPDSHLDDVTVRTKLLPEDQAEVTVIADVKNAVKGNAVSMRLEGQPEVKGEPDANGEVTLVQTVRNPKLWSAEWPNLYELAVDLIGSNGKVTEHTTRKIGIREVSIQNGVFYVNRVPVKLVGICRHDVYPSLGTALNADVWRKDLTLMKAANFNAVRTSHYPYGPGFYDLCDEMGFYVLGEEPFCWVNCDDPELMPAFEQRAREAVQRDKNHPCVVIWGVGNENKPGRDNALAAKITRQLDPTRPRLISCQHADDGDEHVEFDDTHYVTPEQIRKAEQSERRARWPMIYTENPNVWEVRNGPDYGSLDLWGKVIERTWNEIWKDEHVCGNFLWEWADRAVADKCAKKYYDYFPQTGINLVKVKGVVDGFRNPRPEYYHIKMAQCPIAVGDKAEISADGVTLEVTNRYSFTDLKSLRVGWTLSRASKSLASGAATLSLAPRSHGQLRAELPAAAMADADTLRLDFDHPGGWNVLTHQFFLKPVSNAPPAVRLVNGLTFPKFNLLTGTVERSKNGWKHLERITGQLTNVKVKQGEQPEAASDEAALLAIPLESVRSVDADVLLHPSSVAAGHVHAELADGKMSYEFTWSGEKSDIYELGWVFQAPKGIDGFSWDRKARWSWYPPEHIGRPTGTATPHSARAELTKVDRADAFDFNSTKFNCNWASLTDAAGNGLCTVFSPKERYDVRGGFAENGDCTLIVDRCYSPPRDISTPIVKDLYTVLTNSQQVVGSFQINGIAAPMTRN